MSADIPVELKDFHKIFQKLTYRHDNYKVFDHFLDYIIWMHDVRQLDIPDGREKWDEKIYPYSKDERQIFYELYCEWLQVMNNRLVSDKDWYDLFGTYYMAEIVSKSKSQGTGQFFTPANVCTAMAQMTLGPNVTKYKSKSFNDPTCGSGRCLLALNAEAPGNYHFGEDLDLTCCKMTVANFLIHGVSGSVIWKNSLSQEFFGAWKVNEYLNYGMPLPHVQQVKSEQAAYYLMGISKKITKPIEVTESVKEKAVEKVVTLDSFMEAAK